MSAQPTGQPPARLTKPSHYCQCSRWSLLIDAVAYEAIIKTYPHP